MKLSSEYLDFFHFGRSQFSLRPFILLQSLPFVMSYNTPWSTLLWRRNTSFPLFHFLSIKSRDPNRNCQFVKKINFIIDRIHKSRAKLEEYERGSSTCSISPDTLLSLLFPFLIAAAVDIRILFENSRLLAVETICVGWFDHLAFLTFRVALHSRTLSRLSSSLREQCLGLIYQALMHTSNFDGLTL